MTVGVFVKKWAIVMVLALLHTTLLWIVVNNHPEWWTSNFGALLTGFAATSSLVLALIKLGPELEKYYKDRDAERKSQEKQRDFIRQEKIADAAEQLALCTTELISSILFITSPVVLEGDKNRAAPEGATR